MAISYEKMYALLQKKLMADIQNQKGKTNRTGHAYSSKNGTGGLDSKTINRLCKVLDCQPGGLMEYVPDTEEK